MSAVLRSHSETWSQLQQGSDRCTAGAWHLAQDVMQQTVHLQHWPGDPQSVYSSGTWGVVPHISPYELQSPAAAVPC